MPGIDVSIREHLQHAVATDGEPQPCGCHRWIVIHTRPQAERFAQSELQRTGFQTYLPLYATMRRDRVLRTSKHLVHQPLFPTYLFVAISGSEWFAIRRTPGVKQVLLSEYGKPHLLPHGAVEALQATDPQRLLPTAARPPWAPGMACSLGTGPFSGCPAIVLAVDGDMAFVSLMMFGHLREVAVQLDNLVPRDED